MRVRIVRFEFAGKKISFLTRMLPHNLAQTGLLSKAIRFV